MSVRRTTAPSPPQGTHQVALGERTRCRVTRATGTVRHGAIDVRVTRVRVYKSGLGPDHPRPHRGDKAVFKIRRGVLTDPITAITYCNRAASRRGVCGA